MKIYIQENNNEYEFHTFTNHNKCIIKILAKHESLHVQETKMEAVTDTLCRSLWGGDDCAWAFL